MSAVCTTLPAFAADGSALSDFDDQFIANIDRHDSVFCDRALYSKGFDLWIKEYCDGHDKEAEAALVGVFKLADGAYNFRKLGSGAFTRLEFVDGAAGERLEKRGGSIAAVAALYQSGVNILGPSLKVAAIADYVSDQYANSKDFKNSLLYNRKAIAIREKIWGKNDKRMNNTYLSLAEHEYQAGDYVSSRKDCELALGLAVKAHYLPNQYEAKKLLAKLDRKQQK